MARLQPSVLEAPPATLEVSGLPEMHLRQLELSDAGRLVSLVNANRPFLERYDVWAQGFNGDTANAFVERSINESEAGKRLEYAITTPDSFGNKGIVRGLARLSRRHIQNVAAPWGEVGYFLTQEAQGNGYARRGVQAIITHAQESWDLAGAYFTIATDNERSFTTAYAVAEAFGAQTAFGQRSVYRNGNEYKVLYMKLPEGN